MNLPYDIEHWTDWQLDNLNYPYEPEFFGTRLVSDNFDGYNGLYGGYFNGGRYSFEIELPPVSYPTYSYEQVGPEPPVKQPVTDNGATVFLLAATLCILSYTRRS